VNDTPTGRALGQDTYDAQVTEGLAFLQSLNGALPNAAQAAALAVLMAKIAGNATVTHVPGWVRITFDPSSGTHDDPEAPGTSFNRQIPAVAQQVDGSGNFVALWWKTGAAATAWQRIDSQDSVTLSTELPLEDGIADPGATSSGEATAKEHVHPTKDTAGGDLYLIDSTAAVPIVYYASDVIPNQYANPKLVTASPASWDIGVAVTDGGSGRGAPGTP
jgi:hypothetical protein